MIGVFVVIIASSPFSGAESISISTTVKSYKHNYNILHPPKQASVFLLDKENTHLKPRQEFISPATKQAGFIESGEGPAPYDEVSYTVAEMQ